MSNDKLREAAQRENDALSVLLTWLHGSHGNVTEGDELRVVDAAEKAGAALEAALAVAPKPEGEKKPFPAYSEANWHHAIPGMPKADAAAPPSDAAQPDDEHRKFWLRWCRDFFIIEAGIAGPHVPWLNKLLQSHPEDALKKPPENFNASGDVKGNLHPEDAPGGPTGSMTDIAPCQECLALLAKMDDDDGVVADTFKEELRIGRHLNGCSRTHEDARRGRWLLVKSYVDRLQNLLRLEEKDAAERSEHRIVYAVERAKIPAPNPLNRLKGDENG